MKEKCLNCMVRKTFAKFFDKHFDYKDCPVYCIYENDFKKEQLKEGDKK